MNARLFLLAPAFLMAVALLRPTVDVATPPRPSSSLTEPSSERPSLTAALVRLLPGPSAPESEPAPDVRSVGGRLSPPTHENEAVARVAGLLELAYLYFHKERYALCMGVCDRIALIDRDYVPALEIRNLAARLSHIKVADLSPVLEYIDELARQTDEDALDPLIPMKGSLQIPDAEAWSVLSEVVGPAFEREHPWKTDPDVAEIQRKLREEKFDLAFENTSFEEALAFLRDLTGLDILIDAELRGQIDLGHRMNLRVQDLVLGPALRLLLAPLGLTYEVTGDRSVLVIAPYRAAAFAAKH